MRPPPESSPAARLSRRRFLSSSAAAVVATGAAGAIPGCSGLLGAPEKAQRTFVNAKDSPHNATGDGATNDRVAVEAAIDACSEAGGGIVYLPVGTYVVSGGSLRIPSNVELRGAGMGRTVIEAGRGANANVVTSTSTEHVGLRDLTVDATKQPGPERAGNGEGVYFANVSDFALVRAELKNAYNDNVVFDATAGAGTGCKRGLVRGCRITGSRNSHGLALSGTSGAGGSAGAEHVEIVGNHFLDNVHSDVNISQSRHCTVLGNTMRKTVGNLNGYAGVRISNGSSFNMIMSNAIWRTCRGVFIAADAGAGDGPSPRNTVTGNTIRETSLQGVLCESGYNVISSNVLVNCAFDRTSVEDAVRVSNARDVAVVNNVINDTASSPHNYAISVSGTSDYATVTGNTIAGSGWLVQPVTVAGINSKVANNSSPSRIRSSQRRW